MTMTTLRDIDSTELQAELARRAIAASQAAPPPLDEPQFAALREMVRQYIDALEQGNAEDFQDYIFEIAVEAIYGNTIWAWIRGRM
jgi:hypothetical protein